MEIDIDDSILSNISQFEKIDESQIASFQNDVVIQDEDERELINMIDPQQRKSHLEYVHNFIKVK